MPTNNQEKWIDELKEEFQVIEKGTIQGKPYELANDDIYGSLPDLISFLRQEIRQAKIETIEKIKELIFERQQENHKKCLTDEFSNGRFWEDKELYQAISNLKQNEPKKIT